MVLDRRKDPLAKYKVKKGIPMPHLQYKGQPSKYPISTMEVGDCFYLKIPRKRFDTVRRTLYSLARRHGRKISIRKVGEARLLHYGVWRVK